MIITRASSMMMAWTSRGLPYKRSRSRSSPELLKKHLCKLSSPPIRKFFTRMPPPDPYTSDMNVIPRAGVKITEVDKEVMFLILTLWKDDWGLFIARLPLVVDELERLMQADSKADALMSAHAAKILGNIAIIAQCLKQLELYQP
ncbi:hypothetical protein BKA60DRAFT_62282 [Fusarium oxysporum]|nr:hypothetical protein BKA60DRAFT_62282 [Fusarium oxysporum]